jgi:hypothetical protein
MSKKDTPMPMRSSKGNQSHPRGGILRIVVTLAIAVVVTVLAFAPRGALAAAEQSGETGDSAVAAASPDGADSSAAAGATAPSATDAAGTSATSAPSADATDSSASLATVLAARSGTDTVQIQYDDKTEIHSVPDPESVGGRIILYCMNNQSHWPHTTPSISTVPSYIEGYLTPEKFKSQADYEACMDKLLAILYAGYPYNGMNMYTVVDSTQGISADAFNALLNPPSWIRSDFPDSIGDTVFSYSDYPDNTANLAKLTQFVMDELTKYYFTGATTPSGHTSADIRATPFYQAATAMAYATNNETPLKVWDLNHSGADTVTESEAYEATQYAIWAVLGDYGIEYNSLTSKSGEVTQKALAVKLLNYATADKVLRAEPDAGNVKITGGSQFAYDPEYGVWKTGMLSVTEGKNYHGTYTLTLPSGVSAHKLDGTPVSKVSAGTSFYLVSTTKPTATDMEIKASDTLTWLQEYRQYSPSPEGVTASDGKNFQHMIGAVIKQKTVEATLPLSPAKDGNLTVSKTVTGEDPSSTSFKFTVTLGNTSINGTYGGMTFTNGVATVTLKSGESATAEHLPAGTTYTVVETKNDDYASTSQGAGGEIADETTSTAAFTNERLYKLTVSKQVSGSAASKTQSFPITITLSNSDGSPISGEFSYTGGTVSGVDGVTAPANGSLAFTKNGTATVSLSHGQQITIQGIPSGTTYTVTEADDSHDHYDVSYAANGAASQDSAPTGTLSGNATVAVTNTIRTGSLEVSKHVEGESGSKTQFEFTVTLDGTGKGLTGTYGDMEFKDGTATFELGDGDSKTATDLPEGATYTVEEGANINYSSFSEGATGEIKKGETSKAAFTNTRHGLTLPLSGSTGIGATYVAGIAVLALAALWMHARRTAAGKGGDGRD